jgi:hypothetical protein
MTEQQIRDGFEQLEGALAPPADALERVDRRVRSRRRRRRATLAGGAALVLVAVGGTAVALGSGDDGGDVVADDPADPTSTLVMTRPDGSTYAFPDVTVTCEEPFKGAAMGPGERIFAYSPRHIEKGRAVEPWFWFDGLLDRVSGHRTFTFTADWGLDSSDAYPVTVFLLDTDGNEASSSAGGESGTVHVLEASCDPAPVLRLEVDMTLGSEEQDLGSLDVAGELR